MPMLERATITRIGRGLGRTGELAPAGVEATLEVLRAYVSDARRLGATEVAAVGTSALRDAPNAHIFLEPAERIVGAPVEVISGRREAQLTFAGAVHGLDVGSEQVSVVDIGGGSTEIVRGVGTRIDHAVSIDVGSVRLTERHVQHDPPLDAELARAKREIASAIATQAPFLAPPLVGIAGTVTSLAAIHGRIDPYDPARIHGMVLTRDVVAELTRELAFRPTAARASLPGLDARRADVIPVGALILHEILRHADADRVHVSHGGVRYGRASELLPHPGSPETD